MEEQKRREEMEALTRSSLADMQRKLEMAKRGGPRPFDEVWTISIPKVRARRARCARCARCARRAPGAWG